MKQNDTSYRMKGRAVFLVAIMVLSVVAMSTAFVGGAAAVEPQNQNDFGNIEGELVYEGQIFNVSGADIGPDNIDISSENTMYLVEVTDVENGEVASARTVGSAISVEDDSFELDLSGLEAGQYAVSNRSGSSGSFSLPFDVQVQEIDADWDDNTVTEDDDEAEIDIDLGRNDNVASYNLTVWADGADDFDDEMIEQLFTDANVELNGTVTNEDFLPLRTLDDVYGIDVDPDDRDVTGGDNLAELQDEGIVTFELNESALPNRIDELNLVADFSNLDDEGNFPDAGEYEFTFLITDTGAADTASVNISESDSDASFSAGTYEAVAGDIAEFEFELEDTDEAWIQIGDADSDFVDILYVDVDDEDEPVEVKVNTRLLGTSQGLDADQVYDVENADDFESAYHDMGVTAPDNADLFEDDGDILADFDAYVDALGIADQANESLTRPLQPTTYELQIAGTDVDDALFDADAGDGEANDLLDSAVLELVSPSIGDITIHTAPEENADDADEISELVSAATVRDEIAHEDRLIVQVEATGIYGALVAGAENDNVSNVDFDRLEEGFSSQILHNLTETTNESINFEITGDARTGNQDPIEVDLENGDDRDSYVLIDNEGGQFFVVVNTGSDTAFANGDAPDSDVSFTAMLEYDADNDDDRYEFEGDENPDPFSAASGAENYPYLLVGDVLSSSAEFDLVEPDVSFDNLNADDEIQAENIEDAAITGTTNIAPGSDAELRVSSTDASTSFRIGQGVEINEDGEISAMFDFSGQEVGDEFDTRFRASGSTIDTVSSVIVAEGDLGVADPVEDDVEDDEDDVVDDDVVDDDVVDDDDDVEEPTDDETPGFGALVALIALIGAALLAARRQN